MRDAELAMDLPYKLMVFMAVANYAEKNMAMDIGPELSQALQELLQRVNDC